jgi:hypothetical protein
VTGPLSSDSGSMLSNALFTRASSLVSRSDTREGSGAFGLRGGMVCAPASGRGACARGSARGGVFPPSRSGDFGELASAIAIAKNYSQHKTGQTADLPGPPYAD